MFPIVLSILLLIIILTDIIIYFKVLPIIGKSKNLKYFWIGQSFLNLATPVALLIDAKYIGLGLSNPYVSFFFTVFGLLAFSKTAFLLIYLVLAIPSLISKKVHTIVLKIVSVFSLFTFSLFLYGAIWGIRRINVVEVEFASPSIPESFDGYKISHITDMHIGSMTNVDGLVERVVDSINAQNPDLIVFTGDMVNMKTEEITPHIETLKKLKAKDGIITVMGNHDYGMYEQWDSAEEKEANIVMFYEYMDTINWQLLKDETKILTRGNGQINILGIGFYGPGRYNHEEPLDLLVESMSEDDKTNYSILLCHEPVVWQENVKKHPFIELTLSGHTHAMQFEVFGLSPASLIYKHWAGLYQDNDQYLYVNRGLGSSFPARVGAWPEITNITLRHKK